MTSHEWVGYLRHICVRRNHRLTMAAGAAVPAFRKAGGSAGGRCNCSPIYESQAMELENQIRALLQQAPLRYGNRAQVLLGLFGTPDNGFTWQDGELRPLPGERPAPQDAADLPLHADPLAAYDLDASTQSLHAYAQFTQAMNRARRVRFVHSNLDHLAHLAPAPKIAPPEFADGRIGEIPDNVRDDWLLGALEFLLLILRMDAAFMTRTQKNSDQIQAAGALLQALLLRFAPRVAFVCCQAADAMQPARDEMRETADA